MTPAIRAYWIAYFAIKHADGEADKTLTTEEAMAALRDLGARTSDGR